jgi:ATP-dependent RNA helicase DHX57
LEDIIPLLHYQPPRSKASKKESEAVQQAFRDELKSQELDDPSITAIHNIVRADHIDFQVSIDRSSSSLL